MKKEYIIIGAVVLTIGYFVWRNNKKSTIINGEIFYDYKINDGTIVKVNDKGQVLNEGYDASKSCIPMVGQTQGCKYDPYLMIIDGKEQVIYN